MNVRFFSAITLVSAFLFSTVILAQEVPVFDDEPTVNRKLDFDAFENITKLLHAGRMAPHMKCEIKVRTLKEDRKFSTGTKTIEILEVEYFARGYLGDKKVRVVFAAGLAKYGSKVVSNHFSGAGEDIKIEALDPMQHWLRFVHDGKGNLVFLGLGNRLATYPCLVR